MYLSVEERRSIVHLVDLKKDDKDYIVQAAKLLEDAFPRCYTDCGEEEVFKCLEEDKVCIVAIEDEQVVGLVGAMPQYGKTGWELHPLVVMKEYQKRGFGRSLCTELEKQLKLQGCVTIYLGSDDENGSTTLAGTNLFEDTYHKIANIKNIKHHAFEFYQKVGYQIGGVIPDANGIGKPDIWLAKSLVR